MARTRNVLFIQTVAITAVFGGAYFLIRAMPVEACDVMHYRDYMSASGEIEYCGPGEIQFFDMQKMRFPVQAQLTPLENPVPGQPINFRLRLTDYQGEPLTAEEIAVSHTERIHLMAVDASLQDYQHIHPTPTGAPGEFAFTLTPRYEGNYAVYLDFIPLRSGRRVLIESGFTSGEGASIEPRFAKSAFEYSDGDYVFTLEGADDGLRQKKENLLRLLITDPDGRPAKLEPVMNAWAHLVAFDAGHTGFAHLHPLTIYLKGQTLRSPDALDFSFMPDRPGNYRLWAQVSIQGQERFIPFDLAVK